MRKGEEDAQELTRLLKLRDLQTTYLNYVRTRLHDKAPDLQGMVTFDEMLPQFYVGNDKSSRSTLQVCGDDDDARPVSRTQGDGQNIAPPPGTSSSGHMENMAWHPEELVAAVEELQRRVDESEQQINALVNTEGNHVNR